MRYFLTALLLCATALLLIPASSHAQSDVGLILTESAYPVSETVTRLVNSLEERGLTVMSTIDHAANAEGVGQTLRPTQLIIFGNPNLGTQLMQNSPTVAIDLPQKYLVWEDSSGRTFVTYNSVPYLVDRHGITGPQDVLETVTGALANFAGSVSAVSADTAAAETAAVDAGRMEDAAAPETLPVTGGSARSTSFFWVVLALLLVALIGMAPSLRKNLSRAKLLALLLIGAMGISAVLPVQADEGAGLIVNSSPHSVEETVNRLQSAIEERNLTIMMTIDHASNAAGVERELPPTQLIIFGSPQIGSQLMRVNQTVGIDLPQKMLVWQDDEGNVQVAYNDPLYLGERHNLSGQDELLGNVAGALSAIVGAATAE